MINMPLGLQKHYYLLKYYHCDFALSECFPNKLSDECGVRKEALPYQVWTRTEDIITTEADALIT